MHQAKCLLTCDLGHYGTSTHHCCQAGSASPLICVERALHFVRGGAVLVHVQLVPLQPEHTLLG